MKFIRVNMTDQSIRVEDVPEQYQGLGGRGLTSIMINAEVPPLCDPLGPDNKLIYRAGAPQRHPPGQHQPHLHRRQKPPDRHDQGEQLGRQGGRLPGQAGHHGHRRGGPGAGRRALSCWPSTPTATPTLHDAAAYKGMRTYAACRKHCSRPSAPQNTVACIGPAGEYQLAVGLHSNHRCG
jgi:aldehyde:ferredoxin oxidoreductase